jgi:hypothetical protein
MGYSSYIEGDVTFSRPLRLSEVKALEVVMPDESGMVFQLLENITEEVDEEEGTTIIRRTYVGLEPIEDYNGSLRALGYDWHKRLRQIIDALPDGVGAAGEFHAAGEGRMADYKEEKLIVSGREIQRFIGKMVFPETGEQV